MRDNLAVHRLEQESSAQNSPSGFATNPVRQHLPVEGLRILYTGPLDGTSLQRAESLRSLGAEVVHVRSGIPCMLDPSYQLLRVANRIKRHPDLFFANSRLLKLARRSKFDIVWVDKGLWLRPGTLRQLRRALPRARIISFSVDDMCNPANQSTRYLASLPLYDLHVTTKSYNVAELEALGAREMLFLDNSFDPAVHRPIELSNEDRARFAADVGFVGAYEAERAELIIRLAEAGISVTVRGPGWRRSLRNVPQNLRILEEWIDDQEYPRAIAGTRINLAFLRKANRDLQTTRSIEIPACRAFMLAERTDEHQRLFREGIEAEFFDGFEELVAKCRHYLAHESERQRVAEQGHRRCILGSYSNEGRLLSVLDHITQFPPSRPIHETTTASPLFAGKLGLQPQPAD